MGVQLGKLPDLSNLGTDAEAALKPIEHIVKTLKDARKAIPGLKEATIAQEFRGFGLLGRRADDRRLSQS